MTDRHTRGLYSSIEQVWPAELPALEGAEVLRAARALFRVVFGVPFTGKARTTSGRRRSWLRRRAGALELVVNPNQGWKDVVHDLSHDFHAYLSTERRSHTEDHALLELRMAREVVARGWLAGTLKSKTKPAPTRDEVLAEKISHATAAIARWDGKRRRAETALRKLKIKLRRLERARGDGAKGTA